MDFCCGDGSDRRGQGGDVEVCGGFGVEEVDVDGAPVCGGHDGWEREVMLFYSLLLEGDVFMVLFIPLRKGVGVVVVPRWDGFI